MATPDFTNKDFKIGDRVRRTNGKTVGAAGTIVKRGHPHQGWKVRWDQPRFNEVESWVRTVNLMKEGA